MALLILLFSFATAQTNSSILGKWKIVVIAQGGVYYNCKNDSISFSKEMAPLFPDKATQTNSAKMLKAALCSYQLKAQNVINSRIKNLLV